MNKNRQVIIDSILKTNWEYKITVTFYSEVSQARAEKTLRRWWNEIDRQFYGNSVKRQGKRTKRVCLLEVGDLNENFHFHIHAKRPTNRTITLIKYIEMLELAWLKLSSTGYINDFQFNTNNVAWATYTTKKITATNTDALYLDASNFEFLEL